MNLTIDMATMQGVSANRGIGRVSLELSKHLYKEILRSGDSMQLLAYSFCTEKIPFLRKNFEEEMFQYVYLPQDKNMSLQARRRTCSVLIEDKYRSLETDVIFLGSVFSDTIGYGMEYPFDFRNSGKFVVAFQHDLIPFIFKDEYLQTEASRQSYLQGINRLKSCDLLLVYSETTRRDTIKYLGIPDNRIINVGLDASDVFSYRNVSGNKAILRRIGLKKPFAMYAGGTDWRKNVEGLIKAWSILPEQVKEKWQLLLVGGEMLERKEYYMSLFEKLGMSADDIVLGGYVQDEDLADLYRLSDLFIFPSFYEGFGLPILEAMRCGCPVIGADNSSIREILQRPEALFDSSSTQAMANAIEHSLKDLQFRQSLKKWGLQRSKDYSWRRTAQKTLAGIRKGLDERGKAKSTSVLVQRKQRRKISLAWISPLFSQEQSLDAYAREILPRLDMDYQIDVFTPSSYSEFEAAAFPGQVHPLNELPNMVEKFDLLIYQLKNNQATGVLLPVVLAYPGLVVMHDFFLGNCFAGHDADWMCAEAEYSHGWQGLAGLSEHGEKLVVQEYPFNKQIMDSAFGLIFHQSGSMDFVRRYFGSVYGSQLQSVEVPDLLIRYRELTTLEKQTDVKKKFRKMQEIDPDSMIVVATCSGRNGRYTEKMLKALRLLERKMKISNISLVFIDEGFHADCTKRLYAQMQLLPREANVHIANNCGSEQFELWLQLADIVVILEDRCQCEFERLQQRCLYQGIPILINKVVSDKGERTGVFYVSEYPEAEELVDKIEVMSRRLDELRQLRGKFSIGNDEFNKVADSLVAVYRERIELAIQEKSASQLSRFIKAEGQQLAEESCAESDYALIAECYEKNHQVGSFRRIYVCLPQEYYLKFLESCPNKVADNPLYEIVPCAWDAKRGFQAYLPTDDIHALGHTVTFHADDCLLITRTVLEENCLKEPLQGMAHIYVVCDSSTMDDLNEEWRNKIDGIACQEEITKLWQQIEWWWKHA